MSVGELWVANPLFPWIVLILTAWVVTSIAVQVRNWIRICKLERTNKFLQEMIMGGVHGLSQRILEVKEEQSRRSSKSRSRRRKKRNKPESGDSQEHRIQFEEPEPAAIEEIGEGSDSPDVIASASASASARAESTA